MPEKIVPGGAKIARLALLLSDKLKDKDFAERLVNKYHEKAEKLPAWLHRVAYDTMKDTAVSGEMGDLVYNFVPNIIHSKPNVDNTFLLDPKRQKEALVKMGYRQVDAADGYGLVNAAVQRYKDATGRDVPMYQVGADDAVREDLIPLNNRMRYHPAWNYYTVTESTPEGGTYTHNVVDVPNLGDTASAPTRYYRDVDGNLYAKSWDFFDHGNYSRRDFEQGEQQYMALPLSDMSNQYGNLLDIAGNPFVRTTGYMRILPDANRDAAAAIVGTEDYMDKFSGDYLKALEAIRGGDYDIKDYASGGNLFWPGGLKKRVSEFTGGLLSPEDVGVIMKHPTNYADYLGWDDAKINELKQNFYDHFFPWGYDILAGIDAMRGGEGQGKPIGVHDKEGYARDYLLAEYLGIPADKRKSEKSNEIFETSQYRPSQGDKEGDNYVRFSTRFHRNKAVDIYNNLLSNVVYLPGQKKMKSGKSYQTKVGDKTYRITPGKSGNNYAVAETSSYQFDVDPYASALGQYTIGTGIDPKRGQYISVYDKWDLNPFSEGSAYPLPRKFINTISSIGDASGGIGNPVNYYDRIYLDDYYGTSFKPEPGTYYGGYLLPVEVTASRDLKTGGKIHIAPSKRGTFTAAAKKHGKSVQAFASQVLANKENYSSAMVKKANFARNAKKWKHADGGLIDRYGSDRVREALRKIKGL